MRLFVALISSCRYPCTFNDNTDDIASIGLHKIRILEEMDKSKPNDSVFIPLMKSTFSERRMYIQTEATCVREILVEYPPLT